MSLSIKITHSQTTTTRKFSLPTPPSLSLLISKTVDRFNLPLTNEIRFEYEDKDGDRITLSSNEEFEELLSSSDGGALRFWVFTSPMTSASAEVTPLEVDTASPAQEDLEVYPIPIPDSDSEEEEEEETTKEKGKTKEEESMFKSWSQIEFEDYGSGSSSSSSSNDSDSEEEKEVTLPLPIDSDETKLVELEASVKVELERPKSRKSYDEEGRLPALVDDSDEEKERVIPTTTTTNQSDSTFSSADLYLLRDRLTQRRDLPPFNVDLDLTLSDNQETASTSTTQTWTPSFDPLSLPPTPFATSSTTTAIPKADHQSALREQVRKRIQYRRSQVQAAFNENPARLYSPTSHSAIKEEARKKIQERLAALGVSSSTSRIHGRLFDTLGEKNVQDDNLVAADSGYPSTVVGDSKEEGDKPVADGEESDLPGLIEKSDDDEESDSDDEEEEIKESLYQGYSAVRFVDGDEDPSEVPLVDPTPDPIDLSLPSPSPSHAPFPFPSLASFLTSLPTRVDRLTTLLTEPTSSLFSNVISGTTHNPVEEVVGMVRDLVEGVRKEAESVREEFGRFREEVEREKEEFLREVEECRRAATEKSGGESENVQGDKSQGEKKEEEKDRKERKKAKKLAKAARKFVREQKKAKRLVEKLDKSHRRAEASSLPSNNISPFDDSFRVQEELQFGRSKKIRDHSSTSPREVKKSLKNIPPVEEYKPIKIGSSSPSSSSAAATTVVDPIQPNLIDVDVELPPTPTQTSAPTASLPPPASDDFFVRRTSATFIPGTFYHPRRPHAPKVDEARSITSSFLEPTRPLQFHSPDLTPPSTTFTRPTPPTITVNIPLPPTIPPLPVPVLKMPGSFDLTPVPVASTSRERIEEEWAEVTPGEVRKAVERLGFDTKEIGVRIAVERSWEEMRGKKLEEMVAGVLDKIMV